MLYPLHKPCVPFVPLFLLGAVSGSESKADIRITFTPGSKSVYQRSPEGDAWPIRYSINTSFKARQAGPTVRIVGKLQTTHEISDCKGFICSHNGLRALRRFLTM